MSTTLSSEERSALGIPIRPQAAQRPRTDPAGSQDDMSASEMSDKNPAGLHPYPPRRHSRAANEKSRERRRVSLDVRLTEAEREAIRLRARVLGVKPSTWARGALLDSLDSAGVRRSDGTQRRVCSDPVWPGCRAAPTDRVNLNQTLRSGAAVDEDLVREVQTSVDAVRSTLGDRTAT